MSLLTVKNIHAGYRNKNIIRDINFVVDRGEIIALLGLNGTGKTTLLKVISGLIKPQEGVCLIGDRLISPLKERERARRISYIPQRNSIIYDTQVLDVVLMGITPYLRSFESPTKLHRKHAYQSLQAVGMERYANDNFLTLSEGQKQLVLISRSLLQNAEIMLFDEPDSSLDYKNKHMVLNIIRGIIRKQGKGGIITLHDPNYALSYCDRILILDGGSIISQLDNKKVRKEDLYRIFRRIYGNIDIIQHKNNYVMV